jgi:hypothetical protein
LRYPSEFSTQARNRIEAAKIMAYKDFAEAQRAARWNTNVEPLLRHCALRIFLVFAQEACALGKRDIRGWSIDRIDNECREFLRRLAIQAWHDHGFRSVTSRYTGAIEDSTERAFRAAAEWQAYQDLLQGVAKDQVTGSAFPRTKPGPKRDVETARRVAEIVAGLASNRPTELADTCEALDAQKVPTPRTWRKAGIGCWSDAADDYPDRAKKAIQHHLKNNQR